MLTAWEPKKEMLVCKSEPHQNRKGEYVAGQIRYWPLRLGWASTCHKSQGLSLDRVQVDVRNKFFALPAWYIRLCLAAVPSRACASWARSRGSSVVVRWTRE